MNLWHDEQFDVLIQEAIRCDWSLRNSCQRPLSGYSQQHLIKVFTRLMLEGNVCVCCCPMVNGVFWWWGFEVF